MKVYIFFTGICLVDFFFLRQKGFSSFAFEKNNPRVVFFFFFWYFEYFDHVNKKPCCSGFPRASRLSQSFQANAGWNHIEIFLFH